MRLDFNVLWVDDQPDRIKAQIETITLRMQEEGFRFNATPCKSVQQVTEVIQADVFTDEIDLILVDWDLDGDSKGQDAIAVMREKAPYKDVVFYSAQTEPQQLRQLAFEKGLEGVYCTNRENLVEEVLGVFESLVKKVLDLDHTRGIVMGATSDIDHIVNTCIEVLHQSLGDGGKAKMFKEAQRYVDKRLKEIDKLSKNLKSATTLTELFQAHMIFTSNDRLRLLKGTLKGELNEVHVEYKQTIVDYQQNVVPDRNKLGHMKLVPEGKPETVIDSGGNEVSVEDTRKLRRLILKLRTDFRALLSTLQSKAAPPTPTPTDGK